MLRVLLGGKMNTAAIALYQPSARSLTWCAFAVALAVHFGAVILAASGPEAAIEPAPPSFEIIAIVEDPAQPQIEQPEIDPPVLDPPLATQDDDFVEEKPTPPPVRPRIAKPAPPIAKPAVFGRPMPSGAGAVKVFALSAPRPDYPYQARAGRVTGSGIALLSIDIISGNVTDVRILHSTGSPILDNATVAGLRRWRFKAGSPPTIRVPITFTLTGAVY